MTEIKSSRLFIIGSERSGTNLLRSLLGNHPAICAPQPIHFCNQIGPYFKSINLIEEQQRLLLYDGLLNTPFSNWGLSGMNPNINLDLVDAMDFFYSAMARKSNASFYVNKDNDLHEILETEVQRRPDSKFIYIYRDPRDVVASWLTTPVWHTNPISPALHWDQLNSRILSLEKQYPENIYRISYNELTMRTQDCMRKALYFCNIPIDERCFSTKQTGVAQHVLWANINKPIIENNSKWKSKLSLLELVTCESHLTGRAFCELGFRFSCPRLLRKTYRLMMRLGFVRKSLIRFMNIVRVNKFNQSGSKKSLSSLKIEVDGGRFQLKQRIESVISNYHDSKAEIN